MYQRNREIAWKRIKIGFIVAALLHFPFFVFASSYTFSKHSIATAYFFFFTDMLFWII